MDVILKKLKHPQVILIISAILIFCVILFSFGSPYADKSIIGQYSHISAAKESSLTYILFFIRRYLGVIGGIGLILFLLLFESVEYQYRNLTCEPEAKKLHLTVKIMLASFVISFFAIITNPIIEIINLHLSREQILREYSRAGFVWDIGWGLMVLVCVYSMVFYGIKFLSKKPSALVAVRYLWKYNQSMRNKDIDSAKIAVEKACEADPYGIVPWAVRASFTLINFHDNEVAKKYFETAMQNFILTNDLCKSERSIYEYNRGLMLLGDENITEAIKAIELSLKLEYNIDKDKFLNKLRQQQKLIP